MKTPFTTAQFFSVFEQYNRVVFPMQILILLTGIVAFLLIVSKKGWKNRLISGVFSFLWLWIGAVYHVGFFSGINAAAYGFGLLFIIQGLLFLRGVIVPDYLVYAFNKSLKGYFGIFFIVYGLLIYPVVGYLVEQNLYHTISLGLPCPTVIFTFGFLLATTNKVPRYLLIIPTLWALIGISTVINLDVYQDSVMLLAAIAAAYWLLWKRKTNLLPDK